MNIINHIKHLLGTNTGRVKTWWKNDRLMVGFECSCCGKIFSVEDITNRIERDICNASEFYRT